MNGPSACFFLFFWHLMIETVVSETIYPESIHWGRWDQFCLTSDGELDHCCNGIAYLCFKYITTLAHAEDPLCWALAVCWNCVTLCTLQWNGLPSVKKIAQAEDLFKNFCARFQDMQYLHKVRAYSTFPTQWVTTELCAQFAFVIKYSFFFLRKANLAKTTKHN